MGISTGKGTQMQPIGHQFAQLQYGKQWITTDNSQFSA